MRSKSPLDVRSLVQDLGGRARIPGALREHGIAEVTEQQVDKWLARNSIPSRHLGALLLLAWVECRPIQIYQYMKDTREWAQTPIGRSAATP